jgi:hypothetical protein
VQKDVEQFQLHRSGTQSCLHLEASSLKRCSTRTHSLRLSTQLRCYCALRVLFSMRWGSSYSGTLYWHDELTRKADTLAVDSIQAAVWRGGSAQASSESRDYNRIRLATNEHFAFMLSQCRCLADPMTRCAIWEIISLFLCWFVIVFPSRSFTVIRVRTMLVLITFPG